MVPDGQTDPSPGVVQPAIRVRKRPPVSPSPPPSPIEPAPDPRTSEHSAQAPTPIKVLLVDTHHLVLEGLAILLMGESDFDVVATASSVEDAAARAAESSPDVVVLDPDLGGEDGLRLMDQLGSGAPSPRVLALTALDNPDVLQQAVAAGVTSYLLKRARFTEVAAATRQTAAGETVISPEFVRRFVSPEAASEESEAAHLTLREQEVLEHISAGATNARIAQQAGISVRTAQKHVENLFTKLGVHDRAALVAEAFRRGLLR